MHNAPDGKPSRASCDPSGIRTRVTAVRGQRTRPLYDGAEHNWTSIAQASKPAQTDGLGARIEHGERLGRNLDVHGKCRDTFAVAVSDEVR